ncbi:protein-(glutamine-N5) methyltransferase, release factor-specific [Flavobacterium faecale]|uniref:Release factor glutamine methyltransferase n=1 Tax=Flavobacterium faecale TaxID=1355330 RepID=A0A2S1LIQ3_9FLAO|nr:peptide chain release factor N(5)-glutamine methyltransferase [Flavobacterium faecale]AWG23511.1 protein-(glutamine-N5) methyltransferase, release factor-specific [Flavobacterium faecale]
MNIRQYRSQFISKLAPLYGEDEAESFFYLILENKRQLQRVDLAMQPDLTFSEEELAVWSQIEGELEEQKPIQYLLGCTSFFGLEFMVNENVLIPRPETEELVDWIVQSQKLPIKKDTEQTEPAKIKILDIGTGSGCIAIALAKNIPNAEVFAIDVSIKALATARKNAENNAVSVTFLEKNILETLDLEQQFDIIVSNPPYVRNLEKAEIKNNVLENEPHLALFVADNDALIFYSKIAQLATKNLNPNGKLFFEINQYLGKEMTELLQKYNFKNIALKKDIYGNDRMMYGEI